MNFLKTIHTVLISSILMTVLSCKAQKLNTALPKIENHLIEELDYTHEAIDLVQKQENGEEISLGRINTDGTINFNLPEYDIKALFDGIPLQHYNFHSWFSINSDCKDRDIFAETPFNDVYSQKTNAIFIKKYGINVAVLEATSDKEILRNHNATQDSLEVSNTYNWFYIDRAITYKEDCAKIGRSSGETYATINTDIAFDKGWNFIEENTKLNLNYNKSDPNSIQLKKILFTKSAPTSNKVKWTLRQVADNARIQTAKKLHNLTPLTEKQFEKWAPNKLGDLSVTINEHGMPPTGFKNKNNIHLTFANETQKKEIDLYVIDCAKSFEDMEMVNFAFAMENNDKAEKDIKPYITQYNELEKATQLFYKAGDRIIVNASGVNMNGEELWGYIEKLKVEKLLKK